MLGVGVHCVGSSDVVLDAVMLCVLLDAVTLCVVLDAVMLCVVDAE